MRFQHAVCFATPEEATRAQATISRLLVPEAMTQVPHEESGWMELRFVTSYPLDQQEQHAVVRHATTSALNGAVEAHP